MGFVLLSLGMIIFILAVLVIVGRAYPGGVADLVDWKPTRSYEDEARMEEEDIQQMIDAQNEYRRRRGAPEITEGDIRRQAAEDERLRAKAQRWNRLGQPDDD